MSNEVKEGKVVGIVYDLLDERGGLLEERTPDDPLYYVHGKGLLLTALEKELEGKAEGHIGLLKVAPENGYGPKRSELIATVSRSNFPAHLQLKVGMKFDTHGPNGEKMSVEITAIEEDQVTIDGNHPLAGVELNFDYRIILVRDATTTELEKGVAAESISYNRSQYNN